MAPQTSLEHSYYVLIQFLMLSKHRLVELGAEHGLTGIQAITLFLLDEPRPMYSFKKIYNCDASNVTGIIDGLEEKGLVTRYEPPEDRRIKVVETTEHGRKLRSDLICSITTNDNPLLARLSPAELKTFVGLLEKVTAAQ